MRKTLRKIYYHSKITQLILKLPKILFDAYRYKLLSDEDFLKRQFKREAGYEPNLKNPKTFNEKLQWLKLHDRTELHTICADKYAVRNFITKEIGEKYLIPLLLHTTESDQLQPSTLPNKPFIIKATHSSGRNLIVKNPNQLNWRSARKRAKKWLKENYYHYLREWQYKNIPPAIVVEELLMEPNGEIPLDYKFFCFNGKIEYIEVHENRFSTHKKLVYNESWEVLDFISTRNKGKRIDKPINFDLMKSIVHKLSKHFYFVRVDLYNLKGSIYFGELTFQPGSGYRRFRPKKQDRILGDKLNIPVLEVN